MGDWKNPAISTTGVQHEEDGALRDAQAIIWERGEQIIIRLNAEQTITRDRFNSIKKRNIPAPTTLTFYAYPIIFNPTDKQREDSGLRERTQVILHTAMLDWTAAGFAMTTLKDINSIKASVIIDGAKYEIRDKALRSMFSNTYLYVVLGLNRI